VPKQEPIAALDSLARSNMSTVNCPPGTYVLSDNKAMSIREIKNVSGATFSAQPYCCSYLLMAQCSGEAHL
jgi:hypothetical protein